MQDSIVSGMLNPRGPDALSNATARVQNQGSVARGEDPARLRMAAKEFEALFLGYMLSVMRSSIEESDPDGQGLGKDTYTELFDQELARTLADRGALGISDLLMKKLSDPLAGGALEGEPIVPRDPIISRSDLRPGVAEEIPDFRMPVHAHLSSSFGSRNDPFTHELRFHRGVDLAAPDGMDVRAAAAGRVTFSGFQEGYGNTIVVQHPGGFETRYAHLKGLLAKTGDWLQPAQILGTVGSTGRSTGPHLHFEVRRYGEAIDPASLVTE